MRSCNLLLKIILALDRTEASTFLSRESSGGEERDSEAIHQKVIVTAAQSELLVTQCGEKLARAALRNPETMKAVLANPVFFNKAEIDSFVRKGHNKFIADPNRDLDTIVDRLSLGKS